MGDHLLSIVMAEAGFPDHIVDLISVKRTCKLLSKTVRKIEKDYYKNMRMRAIQDCIKHKAKCSLTRCPGMGSKYECNTCPKYIEAIGKATKIYNFGVDGLPNTFKHNLYYSVTKRKRDGHVGVMLDTKTIRPEMCDMVAMFDRGRFMLVMGCYISWYVHNAEDVRNLVEFIERWPNIKKIRLHLFDYLWSRDEKADTAIKMSGSSSYQVVSAKKFVFAYNYC